ncbi:hypothetical protein JCGZ_04195 [Jatropha curcas]|uniref:Aminotransferase-like plant mobile domain-containing protein n=1 Tax=Jatropha curcas TaxID=180498 RepID=A0A067JKT1_JATCU|nr:hypothetical protein JCGZ_04195 [Jatropha curcas]
MTSPGHSSDEDFLESLGISLDPDLTADADTHASVTGIYAQGKELLGALAERWWDTTNTFHFAWGEMKMTPTNFSVISGIPFGVRPAELYNDWRIEVSPDRMVELIGIDLPRIVGSGSSTPALSVSRRWLSLQAPDIYARYRQGELTATQLARFTLLLLFASTFWSNRKEKFNPSILKSLKNLAHLEEYDWV